MSANLARLRKRAAELEQKKLFDKALEVYIQILDEGGKDLGDEDVPLFNRVGDMLMRKGSVTEALGYYERAVDLYAERGFLNNAIALCSKILRQSPGRAAVYYKLGRISARKGFKSDARKNFLEYADRMQKAGQADEAFRALKEFASLYPDQDDVRLVLAELLSKENRKGEAIEQLQALYEKLEAEGRRAEARATIDRMRAIDPSVTPREGAATPLVGASDLVFLDLSDDEPRRLPPPTPSLPVSARAPVAAAVPALSGLSLTFMPDESEVEPPAEERPPAPEPPERPEGFEATAVMPPTPEAVASVRAPTPFGSEVVAESGEAVDDALEPVADDELVPDTAASAFEVILEDVPVRDATGTPAGDVQLIEDLFLDEDDAEARPAVDDFVAPLREQPPMSGSEFADIELVDVPRTVVTRDHDLALPGDLPAPTPEVAHAAGVADLDLLDDDAGEAAPPDELIASSGDVPMSPAAADDARVAAEEFADLAADIAAREHLHRPAVEALAATELEVPDADRVIEEAESLAVAPPDEPVSPAPGAPDISDASADAAADDVPDDEGLFFGAADVEGAAEPSGFGGGTPDDFLNAPPTFGAPAGPRDHAFPPLVGLDDDAPSRPESLSPEPAPPAANGDAIVPEPAAIHTPRSTISIGSAEAHLRRRLELEPENWDLRRRLGEALLDTGDRDGGLYELELAMVGFELDGDLDRAQEVADEILGLMPSSVRHHQKRVEYAVRSRDRARLTHAYLELADALFRTGAGEKAVAVYGRVLELDGENERAEFALATLAPELLASARGAPPRPDRWTEELVAIEGPLSTAATPKPEPGSALPDESEPGADAPPDDERAATEAVALSPPDGAATEADAPVDEAALPDDQVADAEPVVAALELDSALLEAALEPSRMIDDEQGAWDDRSAGTAAAASDLAAVSDGSGEGAYDSLEAPPASRFATPLDAPVTPRAPTPRTATPFDTPAVPRSPTPRTATPFETPAVRHEPTPRSATPLEAPAAPRSPTPLAIPVATRSPTPRAVPTPSRLDRVRHLTPVGGSDAEFVDLGEWLRTTEPARSTRMQVEDPKPTGDEQADFDELLRRFKRGVAENVEAEDYEAHYDLGVAYKEMGLTDEAIAQFQKALRGASHRVRAYEALGQCFVEKQQYPIAAALLQRATELPGTDDQQLVGVLYLLGFAIEHQGRAADALPYYLRVFAVDIEFRDIAQRVAALGNPGT